MSVQHANIGIVKKDLQLYYNREFVKSFRGEATINTCDLNTRVGYVWANGVATRDTTAPSTPPITGFEIAKLRSTDGLDTQTILYTAAVDQVNGGVYTHSAYIYLESGTWVKVGQHWNPWDYGVQTYIPLNKWTRVSYTVTNSAANYGVVACSYNTDGVIYITATQYEKKSYSTPFVNGSRTANTIAGGGGLLDISGNNVNADLTNVSFDSTGYIFNGSGNYIDLPASTFLDFNLNNFSIFTWINSSATAIFGNIFNNMNVAATLGVQFFTRPSNGGCRVWIGDLPHNDTVNVTNGSWNYIGFVRDGDYVYFYVNGSLSSTGTGFAAKNATPDSGNDRRIGRQTTNTAYDFNGKISNFKIYSRLLTAAEVLQNFNATRTTYGL